MLNKGLKQGYLGVSPFGDLFWGPLQTSLMACQGLLGWLGGP